MRVTVSGNLTGDPELRFSKDGKPIASGGIAENVSFKVQGEWQERTNFFRWVAFGPLAENLCATLNKGTRVVLVGELDDNNYTNAHGTEVKDKQIKVSEGGPSCMFATCTVDRIARTYEKPAPNPGTGYTTSTKSSDGPAHQPLADEEPW